MKSVKEHIFTGETVSIASYDPTKTNLGSLIKQYNLGSAVTDKFVSPVNMSCARPMEASTGIVCANPTPIQKDATTDWVLFSENSAASPTRRVVLYTFNRETSVWAWVGFITLTFPTATNHTIRGFTASRQQYTTGTVEVNGTAVTGSGTAWNDALLNVGTRIGFGSTDPNEISTWYEIGAIGSNTSITLTGSAGTIGSGTPYVIDDWRLAVTTTNATVTNGGLFIVKGLRPELFTVSGTTISAATTVDRVRAVYWLADAATVTNTVASGLAENNTGATWTSKNAYVVDATGRNVYVYNLRASLTGLASGKTTAAFLYKTGQHAVFTGTVSQTNNGVIATIQHGAGNGVQSLYFVTTTRVYRAALSNITDGNTAWTNDMMVEIPPGSVNTFILTSAMTFIEYSSLMDRFIITTSGASGTRSYVTKYYTDSTPFDNMFLIDAKNQDHTPASSDSPIFPSINASAFSTWSERGLVYVCRNGATAALNQVYPIPIAAHWGFLPDQCVITPKLDLNGATKLYRLYVNSNKWYGENEFRVPPDAYRISYRTNGIDDNSGGWTMLGQGFDLSGITPSNSIQFKIEFRVIGGFSLTSRIMSMAVVYEIGDSIPPEYAWNHDDTTSADGTVGFIQTELFGATPPVHTIHYYRADNDNLVFTQASSGSTNGVFEYWDGDSWEAGLGSDTLNTRRRFRPTAGLPAGVSIYTRLETV